MKKLSVILGALDKALTAAIKWLTIALFAAIGLIVLANILLRIFPITSLHWTDEIVEFCFAWMVFYGAAGVWMTKGHFSVGDWIGKLVKAERAKRACRLVLELGSLLFALALLYYSYVLATKSREASSVFQIPKRLFYSAIPVSSLVMVLYSIVYVAKEAIGLISPKALEKLEEKKAG
jgi:TRAP-type C4-dicarboxylate transport system permease small subunit